MSGQFYDLGSDARGFVTGSAAVDGRGQFEKGNQRARQVFDESGASLSRFLFAGPRAPVVLGNSGRGPLGTRRAGPHSATGSISVASSAGFLPFPSDRVIA